MSAMGDGAAPDAKPTKSEPLEHGGSTIDHPMPDANAAVPKGSPKPEGNVAPSAAAMDAQVLDDRPKLRKTNLQLPADIREQRPSARDVVVIALGSHGIRYGFASDSTPRRVFPAVALPRRPPPADASAGAGAAICVPAERARDADTLERAREDFDDTAAEIEAELALGERRRGGGRPIPWRTAVEAVQDDAWRDAAWLSDAARGVGAPADTPVVGREVQRIRADPRRAPLYDIVFPIWDGKLVFDCGAPASLVRYALEIIFAHIVSQLLRDRATARRKRRARERGRANGSTGAKQEDMNDDDDDDDDDEDSTPLSKKDKLAKCFVTVVVPETSHRRDVAEIVGAVFNTRALQAAAVFVHQSTVSCALGAGLATCAVVDIGHSATTVACVEDGIICGESRIHLKYGSHHIQKALDMFMHLNSNLHDLVTKDYDHCTDETDAYVRDEEALFVSKLMEQTGGFNVDENDTMKVTTVKAPSGRSIKVSLGVGIRTVPCFGLIYPRLLKCAYELRTNELAIPARGMFEKNSEDDNFVSDIFNDLRRSGIATAALPIGLFANDRGQPAETTVHSETASIVDAIIWSVARAVEIKRPDQQSRTPDHYRRYLNAIVLAGGGASIDGIALALESRIKKGFQDSGVNISDVTVIDGGKGKGDEELAAAAAVLKDVESEGELIDDTDTASLPWKGGAVMVEADVVNEYWVYRDEWEARNVRALRERAPFYW